MLNRLGKTILPIGLLVLVGTGVLGSWSTSHLIEAIHLERQANLVQDKVEELYELIQVAELSQRGYLLTGKVEDFEQYRQASMQLPVDFRALNEIMSDSDRPSISRLVIFLQSRARSLKVILNAAESGRVELARQLLSLDQSDQEMREIRTILDSLNETYKQRALSHESTIEKFTSSLVWALSLGTLVSVMLVVFSSYLSRLELHRRTLSEAELRSAEKAALVASKLKSQFLATVSHEIRTPLNGIIGMSDLLRGRLRDSESRRFIEIIHDSGEALLRIVNDILDFSKIEAGRVDFEITEFSVLETVQTAAELMGVKAREKNLGLLTYVDPEIPAILLGDASRVSQILRNLIGNAVKFTDSGEILVRGVFRFQSGSKVMVRFDVQDTGPGISAGEEALLFQPFNQLPTTSKTREGTGLGLSICKNLVEQMGGQIGVESQWGSGSNFWFEIPFRARDEDVATKKDQTSFDVERPAWISVGGSPFLDQVLARYALEVHADLQCVDDLQTARKVDRPTVILTVDDPKSKDLVHWTQYGFELNPKAFIAISKQRVESAEISPGSSLPVIQLSEPFSREQWQRALAGLGPEHDSQIQLAPLRSSTTSSDQTSALVLLAEDNATNQLLAETLLEEAGYRVHTVANGQEVLEALSRVSYDLILMDCHMPVMDGFEATKQIRSLESKTSQHTPIIAFTANVRPEDREHCLAAGMDDFLTKPFKKTELFAALKKYTHSSPAVVDWSVLSGLAKQTNPSLVTRLIESFLGTLPASLNELHKSLTAQDLKGLRHHAHQLRSSSATLGALPLSQLCQDLETLVEEQKDPDQVWELAQQLLEMGQMTLQVFREQTKF